MPRFSLSKVDDYRNTRSLQNDIIRIKFPSELAAAKEVKKEELLVFVVDDDPHFLQILNTHFSKLEIKSDTDNLYKFKVRNFATGRSCIENLSLNPDLILLNFYINKGLPNALTGQETLEKITNTNPNQKVLILNDIDVNLRDAFVENGLRDYIIKDNEALMELNRLVIDILNH
ncbi:response regulator [Fulvivirga sp. 29W222]|uniref:Response regulator n=1 Tax=Fulvivirga marina TaxID=2494733 RepID=A0A937KC19_9BACT|nr:response regulator [Fulvivirga marina]MBL6447032.1 response regulator [Fulvivirga marina]